MEWTNGPALPGAPGPVLVPFRREGDVCRYNTQSGGAAGARSAHNGLGAEGPRPVGLAAGGPAAPPAAKRRRPPAELRRSLPIQEDPLGGAALHAQAAAGAYVRVDLDAIRPHGDRLVQAALGAQAAAQAIAGG